MTICVAVIGAGRMGSVVAKQLPGETKKIIVDVNYEQAKKIAELVNGEAYNSLNYANEADLFAVVLPSQFVNDTIEKVMEIAKKGAVIINMATGAEVDPDIKEKNKDVHVVDTKIIGHAKSMDAGEPGLIIAQTGDQREYELIKSQLPGYIDVVQGDAALVPQINAIASTEGIKAAVATRNQLEKMGIPNKWIDVAIRTCCAGTMKAYTENDLGHYAQELVRKLKEESNS
jgi:3-hydroxyisobutyrate dehydrogenase-like beta-hydroxyacid dehydrogenase